MLFGLQVSKINSIQIDRLHLEYVLLIFICLNLFKYDILMSVLLIQLISCTIIYLYPNIVDVPWSYYLKTISPINDRGDNH